MEGNPVFSEGGSKSSVVLKADIYLKAARIHEKSKGDLRYLDKV